MSVYIANFILITTALVLSSILRFDRYVRFLFTTLFTIWLIVFIGLRHEVGGDWYAYLRHIEKLKDMDFVESMQDWNPGYVLIEHISIFLGLGIYGVNTISAFIFVTSFWKFIKYFKIPAPWAFLIAYPYLILVVINGYVRQGIALSFILLAICYLHQRRITMSIAVMLLASLFHESSLVFTLWIIWAIIFYTRFSIKKFFMTIILLFLLIVLILHIAINRIDFLIEAYIIQQMESKGQLIRGFINIFAGFLLIVFGRSWREVYNDYHFWLLPVVVSIVFTGLGFFLNISTVADRLLLYFYPLQIVVIPRVIGLIRDKSLKYIMFILILVAYTLKLLVWLLFAVHRHAWIPYKNIIFQLI